MASGIRTEQSQQQRIKTMNQGEYLTAVDFEEFQNNNVQLAVVGFQKHARRRHPLLSTPKAKQTKDIGELWEPKNALQLGLVTKGKSRQLQEHLKFGSSTLSSLKSGPSQIVLHSPRPDRQDSGTSCTHHNGKLEARLLAGWCRHRVPGTRNHGWPHLFRA
jgi:hypothetical protein